MPLLPLFEEHLRANNEEPHLQVQDILPLDFVTLGMAITHKTQEDNNWTGSCLQSLPTFAATTHISFSCPSIQAIQPFERESVQPEISKHFLESECLATCHTDTTKVVATTKCVMDSSIEFITDKCKDQTLSLDTDGMPEQTLEPDLSIVLNSARSILQLNDDLLPAYK